ncbi:hypothetical protein WICPIJ_009572 [Wickerhamomyces pijperi]|uniref:Uncharacterized protein n=1 Tax=Wickerhamomyces pijperi TaxID=599730 RepID=A0A9P8PMR3_WICPI|nr:hypothetical protein WICPIJ_009572 [Wickerhamomyces pijperi]
MAPSSSHKPNSTKPIPLPTLTKQLRQTLSLPQNNNKQLIRSSKAVDLLAMLNFKLFLKELLQEAELLSQKDGSYKVHSWHLKEASVVVLKKYKG